ncbi:MAG: hypothetical protein MUE88_10880 [Flavobacteriales bacterium]|nr:hypothetical protein [Flavobacteriales bacterium]
MVISSGCPGLGTALPAYLDTLRRDSIETIILLQDNLNRLERGRNIAFNSGHWGSIFGYDQDEVGCYLDARERNRHLLDRLSIKRPEGYHLASSLSVLFDELGRPVSATQYWEYPPGDTIINGGIIAKARAQ